MRERAGFYLIYLLVGACAGALIAGGLQRGTWSDLIIGTVLLLVLVLLSPPMIRQLSRFFPKPVDPQAIMAAPVVVYYRPMCPFCTKLRDRLGRARRKALWVNIWRDPAAAETVRGLNAGNELVPTVIINGTAHPNPELWVVRDALADLPNPR